MDSIKIKYTYTKPYYLFTELLELFSYGEMSMRRLMTECTKDGTSLEKMGFFKLPGIREYLIEPYAFQKYLEAKIIVQPKYDYEVENLNEVKASLKVIHNKQQPQQKGN